MGIKANQIRKGMILVLDGDLFQVTDFEHRKPGKGPAFNQIRCKHHRTGAKKVMKLSSDEDVEQAFLERRACNFSYMDGPNPVFMDAENFEQYSLEPALSETAMPFVRDNQKVDITFYEGEPIAIELPGSVVLKVAEAEIAARGDTVTNDKKRAVCDTGLKIRVPNYIEVGERVKISTETGEFLARASEEDLA